MKIHDILIFVQNVLNWKAGLVSGLFYGPIAASVNAQHGMAAAMAAGLLQAGIMFLQTGFTAGLAQRVCEAIKKPLPAYLFGSGFPAMVTFVLSFTGHFARGTPELAATVVTAVAGSFGTSLVMNALVRNYLRLPPSVQRVVKLVVLKNKDIT